MVNLLLQNGKFARLQISTMELRFPGGRLGGRPERTPPAFAATTLSACRCPYKSQVS